MVAMHLEPYGYMAASAEEWKQPASSSASWPRLRFNLGGHSEVEHHTYYTMECELSTERLSLQLRWQSQKRLTKLREELHDTVKNELGKDYPEVFATAPFAKRGGWHGTSERLKKWLDALADCVNRGVAPPILVSQLLLFLDAPAQSEHQASAQVVREAPEEAIADPEPATDDNGMPSQGTIGEKSMSVGYASAHVVEADPPSAPMEEPHIRATSSSAGAKESSLADVSEDLVSYLRSYSYAAESSTQWCAAPASCLGKPVLRLVLDGHCEVVGHTYYSLQCALSSGKPALCLAWPVQKRLTQLREELHDIVKDGLGKSYADLFAQAPFARRGGVAGTTGRLQTWLEILASCINEHSAPPSLVATVLRFLDTPAPPKPNKGPASPQKMSNRGAQLGSPFLDMTQQQEEPAACAPSSQPPPPLPAPDLCNAATSPIKFEASEARAPSPQPPSPQLPENSDDEEGVAATFSQAKRRNGYSKLRNWFTQLKRSIEKKLLDVTHD